jgi:hypothetical protein
MVHLVQPADGMRRRWWCNGDIVAGIVILTPCSPPFSPFGLVWEMEDSSGWKRIEGDFGKF